MNLEPVAKKLEDMIKAKITTDGLVKTEAMRDSIKVTPSSDGFKLEAVDYFIYLNDKYKIMEEVSNSQEFLNFTANYIAQELQKDINSLDK